MPVKLGLNIWYTVKGRQLILLQNIHSTPSLFCCGRAMINAAIIICSYVKAVTH